MDKENQTNAKACTTENAAAKTKPAPLNDNDNGNNALSPYERRMKELKQARQQAGEEYTLYILSNQNTLLERSGVLRQLDREYDTEEPEAEDFTPSERKRAFKLLSQAQVDKGFHGMIVRRSMLELQKTYRNDLLYADHRNDRESGMVSLSTYSSFCMLPVISKLLTSAVKEVNKAKKQMATTTSQTPNLAQKALEVTLAVTMALHDIDHWRVDTESPEEVDKIAKRLVKVVKDLLCFTDVELGFQDVYSRPALLHYLNELADDWSSTASGLDYELSTMNFQSPKNGQGLGRPMDKNPAPTKKPKTSHRQIRDFLIPLGK